MGPLGMQEMIIIFLLALLLFGPKKLPELGRTIGKALTEFRRAQNELKSTFEREFKSLEQENESLKEVTNSYYYDSYNYDSSSYDSGSYGSESYDSTATSPSTPSASATQDAESTTAVLPAGIVASGSLAAPQNQPPAIGPGEVSPSSQTVAENGSNGAPAAEPQKLTS